MIQTEQVTFRNIYVCTYTYVHEITISLKKRGHEFDGEWGGDMEGFGGRKQKREMFN